jgi:hypothetical protein
MQSVGVGLRSMIVTAGAAMLGFGMVACGDSPSEPQVLNLSGGWNYTESFSSSQAGFSCQDSGTITIAQTGNNFTGSYNQQGTCTDSQGGTYDNSGTGALSGGQVSGQTATFASGGCSYTGTISGNPPNRVDGAVSCTIALGGTNYSFSGTWTATR